jgi:hypothetical protein
MNTITIRATMKEEDIVIILADAPVHDMDAAMIRKLHVRTHMEAIVQVI